jgi:hypothetical protein
MKSLMPFVVSVFAICLSATAPAQSTDLIDFTVVGRVQFSVPADWRVIADKSTAEKTVFAFQIPNAADEGTSDSSNLSITAMNLKSVQDRGDFQKQAPSNSQTAQERDLVKDWECSAFSATQRSTQTNYIIWDCRRLIADSGISVRVAWPHLRKNPPDYDKQMELVLSTFLSHVGPFNGPPKSGVLRHPE